MSLSTLAPATKSESIVYIAFSVVLILWLAPLFKPDFWSTLDVAISLIAIFAPILAGCLFYVKPERLVTHFVRGLVLEKQEEMQRFAVEIAYLFEDWKRGTQSDVIDKSRINRLADQILTGPDAYEDLWVIKGSIYFMISAVLLLTLIGLDWFLHFLIIFIITLVILVSMLKTYRDFIQRCRLLVMLRALESHLSREALTRGMFHSVDAWGQKRDQYLTCLRKEVAAVAEIVADDDWPRFIERFTIVIDASKLRVKARASNSAISDLYSVWFEFLDADDPAIRTEKMNQLRYAQSLVGEIGCDGCTYQTEVERICALDETQLAESFRALALLPNAHTYEYSSYVSNVLIKHRSNPSIKKVVEAVLGWPEALPPIVGKTLVNILDDKELDLMRNLAIEKLLESDDYTIWRDAGVATIRNLLTIDLNRTTHALAEIVRNHKSTAEELIGKLVVEMSVVDLFPFLIQIYSSLDWAIRQIIAKAARKIEWSSLESAILEGIRSNTGSARASYLEILGDFASIIPTDRLEFLTTSGLLWNILESHLLDSDPVVRAAAAYAIGGIGYETADRPGQTSSKTLEDVGRLSREDPDERVRKSAHDAIFSIREGPFL
jgi:hypothetical protein